MRKKFVSRFATALLAASALLTSCVEDIDMSNRYTFTGETMGDYIENRPEEFSSFTYIMKRAGLSGLLKTYGSYTLFAPTNEAIDKFLYEQDSIYQATKDDERPIDTGIHSPYVEELSDSMILVIANSHIIPRAYGHVDMQNGIITTRNMNNRYVSVSIVSDSSEVAGWKTMINNYSKILKGDEEVENGVIHIVDRPVSSSSKFLPVQLGEFSYFSIFYNALQLTGLDQRMLDYRDESYDKANEPAPVYNPVAVSGNSAYPKFRNYGYTAFVEPDYVFIENGINNVEELIERAREWYPNSASEDYKNPDNALYKFVAYHLLDCEVPYEKLVLYNMKHRYFDSNLAFMDNADRYDFYTTMHKRICQVIRPLSSSDENKRENLWINPSNLQKPIKDGMEKHLDIRIIPATEFAQIAPEYESFVPNTENGFIHPIDKILIYDEEEMRDNVFYKRLRIDTASFFPELMTNDVRYCPWEDAADRNTHTIGDICIPDGYCKGIQMNNPETHVHYICPYTWGANLNADDFIVSGNYDVTYYFPPVPAGHYEIRTGYTATGYRSVTQFYVNGKITGIPVDLSIRADDPRIGWIADTDDDEANREVDKAMRNRGYMKFGYDICDYHQSGSNGKISARDYGGSVRYIITTEFLDGSEKNSVRMKNVVKGETKKGMAAEYFEFVPSSIARSGEEDTH